MVKKYEKTLALNKASFQVKKGEIFGYIGPNGAGKTTTIRILLGLLKPNDGEVKVLGYDISELDKIKGRIGFMLEERGLYENLTGYENLEFYSILYKVPKKIRENRIKELIELVGLSGREKEKVKNYSTGMRQRLCLARSLLHEPELLLLDEPTTGLDVEGQKFIRDFLVNLANNKNVTIFITSHNLYEISQICTRIGIINKGEIVACGTLSELQRAFDRKEVEISIDKPLQEVEVPLRNLPFVQNVKEEEGKIIVSLENKDKLPDLLLWFTQNNIKVWKINEIKNSLEDIYLSIVKEEK